MDSAVRILKDEGVSNGEGFTRWDSLASKNHKFHSEMYYLAPWGLLLAATRWLPGIKTVLSYPGKGVLAGIGCFAKNIKFYSKMYYLAPWGLLLAATRWLPGIKTALSYPGRAYSLALAASQNKTQKSIHKCVILGPWVLLLAATRWLPGLKTGVLAGSGCFENTKFYLKMYYLAPWGLLRKEGE